MQCVQCGDRRCVCGVLVNTCGGVSELGWPRSDLGLTAEPSPVGLAIRRYEEISSPVGSHAEPS